MFLCIKDYEDFRNKVLKKCLPGWSEYKTVEACVKALEEFNTDKHKTSWMKVYFPAKYPCVAMIKGYDGTYTHYWEYTLLYEDDLGELGLFYKELKRRNK